MSLSRFLPTDFDPALPVGILAGRGFYPALMVERMRRHGIPLRLVALDGETSPELIESFPREHRTLIKVGQLGRMLRAMESMECRYAIMVGQVRPGRLFKGLHPDFKAFRILRSLKQRNAETIYGAVIAEMESIGVHTLDARSFIDDQLAEPGIMTGGKVRIDPHTLDHGIFIATEVARLDIGQGVVVKRGTVLCTEDFDGTDAMLQRAGKYATRGKLLIKTVKPRQDYRIDVPVFGETTLRHMKEAKVEFAALAADRTILINKPAVIELARKLRIQLIGFEDGCTACTAQSSDPE